MGLVCDGYMVETVSWSAYWRPEKDAVPMDHSAPTVLVLVLRSTGIAPERKVGRRQSTPLR